MLGPVADWLGLGDRAIEADPARARGWLLAAYRFARPDGSAVFGPVGRDPARARVLAGWADRLGDDSLRRVAAHGPPLPGAGPGPGVLPTPSVASADRVLAALRTGWGPDAAIVAADHRTPGPSTRLEVFARGRTWLGGWTSPTSVGKAGPASPSTRYSGPMGECVEWTFAIGRSGRTTRSIALIPGLGLAVLGQQDEGPPGPIEARFALGPGIVAAPDPTLRTIGLAAGRARPAARAIPIGLPCSPYPTDRGSIAVEGDELVVRQDGAGGRRRWLGLVVAWGSLAESWRPLTVACRSRACPPAEAVAARVGWKPRGTSLVVYRSLAPPDLRSVLGLQTRARYLIGSFDPGGEVRPLVKLD